MSKGKSDITIKIFALLIAIILWSYVMGIEDPEKTTKIRNVPVTLTNLSALDRQNLKIMNPQEPTVNVEIAGRKSEIDKFIKSYDKNILVQVDISGYDEGQVKVPVTVGLLNQGLNIRLVSTEPREILFTIEKIITKNLPVEVETIGNLPSGYVLGDISIRPQNVLVEGPRTWVNEVTDVIATVDLANRTMSESNSFPIKIVDSKGNDVRGIEKNPNLVEIDIPVFRKIALPIELQTSGVLPDNYSITNIVINPSRVAITGDDSIKNISKIDTKVVDINTLLDKSAVEVELDLPEGVQLVNPNEKITVSYDIEEVVSRDFTFNVGDITATNVDESLTVEGLDTGSEVRVQLRGSKSILDNINKEDVKLFVDLANLKEGRHTVDIELNEIKGVSIVGISPLQLTINLNAS